MWQVCVYLTNTFSFRSYHIGIFGPREHSVKQGSTFLQFNPYTIHGR